MRASFPITDIKQLDKHARKLVRANVGFTPKVGDVMCHAPTVTPAHVNLWPDASPEDWETYGKTNRWLTVPCDAIFIVLSVAYDSLGNAWSFVSVDGKFGYSMNLVTPEVYREQEGRFR